MELVFAALLSHAEKRPDAIAFVDAKGHITYRQLFVRVQAMAEMLNGVEKSVAIALPDSIDYVVADLGATLAGKRVIPVPLFFSPDQIAHLLKEAAVDFVIGKSTAVSVPPAIKTCTQMPSKPPTEPIMYHGGATRVIYTSGSSGTPKGVVHGDRQLTASLTALHSGIAPTEEDVHLSLLPYAQLLEQICGIFLPILAGGKVVISDAATQVMTSGDLSVIAQEFETHHPTTSLMVPNLLAAWCAGLMAAGIPAPNTLRFVAIGGATTPQTLKHTATRLNIPLYEGYGLSECCAVVAMNTPARNTAGSVGHVLEGTTVTVEAGEIVVHGPTIMEGYLDGTPISSHWHTGDLGDLQDGVLHYRGRKDALIIRSNGRNISPEWVEAQCACLPGVAGCCLTYLPDQDRLCLIVATSTAVPQDIIDQSFTELPIYAQPDHILILNSRDPSLFYPIGTPNRRAMNTYALRMLPETSRRAS
ncbi:MAG: AMP-binding protein [Pseudoruegeria sp.]